MMTNGPILVKKYSKMDNKMEVPSLHQASDCLETQSVSFKPVFIMIYKALETPS